MPPAELEELVSAELEELVSAELEDVAIAVVSMLDVEPGSPVELDAGGTVAELEELCNGSVVSTSPVVSVSASPLPSIGVKVQAHSAAISIDCLMCSRFPRCSGVPP